MNEKEIYMNYKRNNKWLGIIDYKSLVFFVSYLAIVWNILNLLHINLEYKIYILMILIIPVAVMLCMNINSESALDTVITIIRFNCKNKIYVNYEHLYAQDMSKTHKFFLKSNKKN